MLAASSPEEISATLISLFFTAKLNQTQFNLILKFVSSLIEIHIPKCFNSCAEIVLKWFLFLFHIKFFFFIFNSFIFSIFIDFVQRHEECNQGFSLKQARKAIREKCSDARAKLKSNYKLLN